MHVFPAQFVGHGHRLGSQSFKFEVDDLNSELTKDLASLPQGKPVLVVVYEIEEGQDPLQKVMGDKSEMSNNFMKQIHARVKEYQAQTGVDIVEIKKLLKIKLKSRGIDKKSLADLTETELSTAVFLLNTELNPSRFNYSEYLKN